MSLRAVASGPLALVILPVLLHLAACSSKSTNGAAGPEDAGAPVVDASIATDAPSDASVDAAYACNATDPRSVPLVLSVQPDQDEGPVEAVLTPAATSIRMMIYLLGTSQILTTLEQKASAGLKVQVILDQTQMAYDQAAHDALQEAGAEVQWSNPKFAFTHAKTIVVDDSIGVVSSGNYDEPDMSSNRDYTMIDRDPQDVAQLATIFDSDWADAAPDLSCTRLVVSPVNSRARILALINSATKTLDIESLEFGDSQVEQAVAAKAKAGVAVRLLLSDPGFYSGILEAVNKMEALGVTPRDLVTPNLHLKSILVDGTTVYAGSENLSENSLDNNREVGLIFTQPDIFATIQATFDKDWAASVEYSPDAATYAAPEDGGATSQ